MLDGNETYLEQHLLTTDSTVPQRVIAKSDSDTPIQKVVKELATIQAYSDSSDALSYLMPLAWRGAEVETTRAVFRALLQSGTKSGLVHGMTGLVALGEQEGLERLDTALLQGRNEVSTSLQLLERTYKSTDPRGVAILARWLDQGSPAAMRAAAAAALARIHTPEAILVLGPALQDTDFQTRWRAIGGLAMFANNVPIGGAGPAAGSWPFRNEDTVRFSVNSADLVARNEGYYLNFWRNWWSENRGAVAELTNRSR
jgi:hypothetical protein